MHPLTASEYRSWTLLYSVPALKGVLDNHILNHFIQYVKALWLLLQSKITQADVQKAEMLLQSFCSKFARIYGAYYKLVIQ